MNSTRDPSMLRPFALAHIGPVCLLVFCMLCLAACKRQDDAPAQDLRQEATPVRVASALEDEVVERVRAEATLRARAQVQVLAEQMGDAYDVRVDVGDTVHKGDTLARLKHHDLDLQVQNAAQSLRAQEKEYDEAKPLVDKGYISRQAFDELTLLRDQARNNLQRLRTTRSDQKIRAPLDGVVLERHIEQGQKISAGTPLFDVADVSELRLRIPVPERALRKIRTEQSARITLRALDDAQVDASVTKIFPSVDASTGTVLVELTLQTNVLEDGVTLRPGMYARGEIEVERRPDVLQVPRTALVEEGDENYLFVLAERVDLADAGDEEDPPTLYTVSQRPVRTGWRGEGRVEILDGLTPDARFVILGQNRLRDGSLVRIVEPAE